MASNCSRLAVPAFCYPYLLRLCLSLLSLLSIAVIGMVPLPLVLVVTVFLFDGLHMVLNY